MSYSAKGDLWMREDVREGDLRGGALNQVDMNWFGGPFPFDEGGNE